VIASFYHHLVRSLIATARQPTSSPTSSTTIVEHAHLSHQSITSIIITITSVRRNHTKRFSVERTDHHHSSNHHRSTAHIITHRQHIEVIELDHFETLSRHTLFTKYNIDNSRTRPATSTFDSHVLTATNLCIRPFS
jgi:hypothetical protein